MQKARANTGVMGRHLVILEKLRKGTVAVNGKHNVEVLEGFGINALSRAYSDPRVDLCLPKGSHKIQRGMKASRLLTASENEPGLLGRVDPLSSAELAKTMEERMEELRGNRTKKVIFYG